MPSLSTSENFQYYATVIRVHDGDTIVVELDKGLDDFTRPLSLRFVGVDAAELGTTEGNRAATRLQEIVKPNDRLYVMSKGWDRYAQRIDALVGLMKDDGTEIDLIHLGLTEGWLRPWNGRGPRPWSESRRVRKKDDEKEE